MALPGQADDGGVDRVVLQDGGEVVERPERLEAADVGAVLLRVVVEKADELVAEAGAGGDGAHDHQSDVADADKHDAFEADAAVAQVAAHSVDYRAADAQEQGDEHGSVEEDETAVGELPEGQVEEDEDDYTDCGGAGDGVDLFQPDAVAAVAVNARELEGTEEEKDKRQAERSVRDQVGLI